MGEGRPCSVIGKASVSLLVSHRVQWEQPLRPWGRATPEAPAAGLRSRFGLGEAAAPAEGAPDQSSCAVAPPVLLSPRRGGAVHVGKVVGGSSPWRWRAPWWVARRPLPWRSWSRVCGERLTSLSSSAPTRRARSNGRPAWNSSCATCPTIAIHPTAAAAWTSCCPSPWSGPTTSSWVAGADPCRLTDPVPTRSPNPRANPCPRLAPSPVSNCTRQA